MSTGTLNGQVTKRVAFYEEGEDPRGLSRCIPAGHDPKPHFIPDYEIKYPAIKTAEERERYKAVFNDQYSEYKELYEDICTTLAKFKKLDVMMGKLPRHTEDQQEYKRIRKVMQDYKEKKTNPTFLEKKERCDYLKRKLTHIKWQIQEYDTRTRTEEPAMAFF